jgi:hypothetical protein
MVEKTRRGNLSTTYSWGADLGCFLGRGGAGLVKGSAGYSEAMARFLVWQGRYELAVGSNAGRA